MARERDEDLMRAYHEQMDKAMKSNHDIEQEDVIIKTVNSNASRYWISLERACAIVYKIRKGDKLIGIKGNSKRLYESIYNEYLKAREENPAATVKHLVEVIIEQPAPCFALTPQSASLLINKIKRKQWYKERRLSLRRSF